MINTEKNELTVPKGMIQHLGLITVGKARGILHAKTEGTPFNQYLLPTVNVAEIITQDKVFQLQVSVLASNTACSSEFSSLALDLEPEITAIAPWRWLPQ